MDIIKKILKNPYEVGNNLTVEELEKVIILAADKFFNTNTPIISDEIYDLLIDFLKDKAPKSKVLKEIGCIVKNKNKVTLDYWLGSMNKIKPNNGNNEFIKWIEKYEPPYYISDKLDGVSALLVYRKNKTMNLYTRGTANEGTDISNLIKYLNLPEWATVSKTKEFQINNKLAFRGELVIDKKTFDDNWSATMKNARNTVSGLVNCKTVKPKLANDTRLVLYEVVEPNTNIENQYKIIKKLGFNMVHYKIFNNIDFVILSNYLKKRRNESIYTIDGLIIINNELYTRNIKKNPEYAFAYKDVLEDQIAITKVLSTEWNISKDGYIKPILILEPVFIGGVEISRVTAHNAKYLVDNKLGKNAIIELIRSGDVIPYIQKVIEPGQVKLPDGEWHWNETAIDIISDNLNSNDVLVKKIYYFFSSLGAKGVGIKLVEKLINGGFNTIQKILATTQDELINLNIFKEKTASNVVTSVKKSVTDVSLHKLMAASDILGYSVGEEKIKIVLNKYPNLIIDSDNWTHNEFINNLKQLSGWEDKTSKIFVLNFDNFKIFYNLIKSYISIKKPTSKKIKNKWTDKTIVLSGFRDVELQLFLENSGAKISNSISKNTDFLIVKDEETIKENTGKVKKAQELNIPIIIKTDIK